MVYGKALSIGFLQLFISFDKPGNQSKMDFIIHVLMLVICTQNAPIFND